LARKNAPPAPPSVSRDFRDLSRSEDRPHSLATAVGTLARVTTATILIGYTRPACSQPSRRARFREPQHSLWRYA
jgi:hypothetical protein